ncbi:MAG: hypothetical protein NWF04_09645 [Candidatus Bathyarchaeota archaeon]|nr:hypothetical protein [Candidatus Bathyarchaeota archaeon]
MFQTKKEVFGWVKEGKKTIDIRKGRPFRGDMAVFQCGAHHLRLPIIKKETGKLTDIINKDNYHQVIPPAKTLQHAVDYLRGIYGVENGIFTAYYVEPSTVLV